MELKITAFYCLCDDFLISEGWHDDPQCTMSTAEVMATALTDAVFFSGRYEKSRVFLQQHGYVPVMLSKSQFSRRLSRIPESIWRGLMSQLASPFHEAAALKIYLADSFPVPVCRNIRIRRCKIYQDECFRGHITSRKEYFYGLKVHALMTEPGYLLRYFYLQDHMLMLMLFMAFLFQFHLEVLFMEIKHTMPILLKMNLSSQIFT